jgi:hypothetical protein
MEGIKRFEATFVGVAYWQAVLQDLTCNRSTTQKLQRRYPNRSALTRYLARWRPLIQHKWPNQKLGIRVG